ncbi:MAG TPA: hypothetical protein GXX39_04735 [Syntrophothermus lipocalidus]|uniref:Uncharacterized protein n=1 Tax=Syntrophothermus lipocalidus (strain DSM 12680 / TGB-C1) TaxID=643648 RepID=D7CIW3_SYNLT|nr:MULTISPECIES: hypothetical protein [Syntrophothermus]ADI02841.1 hypothetical protein Slip_2094 [Syntrophothermus lipocalidus DSM 12680]NSW82885.1 hypothetical protein [Syntrophothermus sp.]HHV76660.1 hypothetical protein [Syntrophothermus lipocalidus]
MKDWKIWDGTAVKKITSEEIVHDDWEIGDDGQEEREVTIHDLDGILRYSVDILRLSIYLLLGALVVALIYIIVPYL